MQIPPPSFALSKYSYHTRITVRIVLVTTDWILPSHRFFSGHIKSTNLADLILVLYVCYRVIKGSDRLCKVVNLSMQCCGKLLSDSFETLFKDLYILSLSSNSMFKTPTLGVDTFSELVFKLLNNDDIKYKKVLQ